MKKVFKLKELCCAHCAAKMEDAISKLDGVNKVTIAYMTEKLALDADDAKFDDIVKQAKAIIKKIEPDCTLEA